MRCATVGLFSLFLSSELMEGENSIHGRVHKCIQYWSVNPKRTAGRSGLERVIQKWILNNYSMDRIHLAPDRDSGQALLSKVIKPWVV
jgi:hypothetical protein